MSYLVTIKKDGRQLAQYPAIGNAFDLWEAAHEEHGPCSITVVRQK